MTDASLTVDDSNGPEGAEVVPVPQGDFDCCKMSPEPRERWKFLGRQTHYGFDYLIWTLAANPKEPNTLGKRFARVVG